MLYIEFIIGLYWIYRKDLWNRIYRIEIEKIYRIAQENLTIECDYNILNFPAKNILPLNFFSGPQHVIEAYHRHILPFRFQNLNSRDHNGDFLMLCFLTVFLLFYKAYSHVSPCVSTFFSGHYLCGIKKKKMF